MKKWIMFAFIIALCFPVSCLAQCPCGKDCPPDCPFCQCAKATQFVQCQGCPAPTPPPPAQQQFGPAPVQPTPPRALVPMQAPPTYGYQYQRSESFQRFGAPPMAYAPQMYYAPPMMGYYAAPPTMYLAAPPAVYYAAPAVAVSFRGRPWLAGRMARRAARRGATVTLVGGY